MGAFLSAFQNFKILASNAKCHVQMWKRFKKICCKWSTGNSAGLNPCQKQHAPSWSPFWIIVSQSTALHAVSWILSRKQMSRNATSVSIYLRANRILDQSLDTKFTPEDSGFQCVNFCCFYYKSLWAYIDPDVTSVLSLMEIEAVQMRTGVMCTSSMKKRDKVEKLTIVNTGRVLSVALGCEKWTL